MSENEGNREELSQHLRCMPCRQERTVGDTSECASFRRSYYASRQLDIAHVSSPMGFFQMENKQECIKKTLMQKF